MHVDALVAVGRVDAEGRKRGPHVVSGFQCGGGIGAIKAEDVLLVGDVLALAEFDELLGQMIVEGTRLVGHGDRNAELGRVLARRTRSVVDGQHGGDVAGQDRGCPDTHLLGDREEPVDINRRRRRGTFERLDRRKRDRDAGLVVEMAGIDEAVVEEFRRGIDRDDIADIDAERQRLLP